MYCLDANGKKLTGINRKLSGEKADFGLKLK